MRLAASRRRWTGCRKNVRASDAGAEAPSLGTGSDRRPSRQRGGSVWNFLARGCFAVKIPEKGVGFPWISLDSLVRIETYQWVTRDKRCKIFSCPFCPFGIRSTGKEAGRRRGYAEAQKCSSSKLNLDSDFLQSIVASAIPFASLVSNQSRPTACPRQGPVRADIVEKLEFLRQSQFRGRRKPRRNIP